MSAGGVCSKGGVKFRYCISCESIPPDVRDTWHECISDGGSRAPANGVESSKVAQPQQEKSTGTPRSCCGCLNRAEGSQGRASRRVRASAPARGTAETGARRLG